MGTFKRRRRKMRGREGDRKEKKRRRGEGTIKTANGFFKASLPDRHPLYVDMASVPFPSTADPTVHSIQASS